VKRKLPAALFFVAAAMLAFAASSGAVDGTIEINQAKVLANGGFPYAISASGSYRLTGSLTVSANTNAITVTAPNVTVDLNGFSITGPGSSSGSAGIAAAGVSDVTVENGTVTGFEQGVYVGFFGIVRNVHADANETGIDAGNNTTVKGCTANNSTSTGGWGVYCTAACAISGNTVNGNASIGITCGGNGCVISDNTASANNSYGIACSGSGCLISGNAVYSNKTGISCGGSGCLVSGNTIENNSTTGILAADATTGYGGNVLYGNGANFVEGTSMGAKNTNLCGGTTC